MLLGKLREFFILEFVGSIRQIAPSKNCAAENAVYLSWENVGALENGNQPAGCLDRFLSPGRSWSGQGRDNARDPLGLDLF
jgi:hypothetical protein